VSLYAGSAGRIASRSAKSRRVRQPLPRPIFVVGSPRSGTTFLAGALGAHPGLVDLGEVKPVKAAVPGLMTLSEGERAARLRRSIELVRTFGLARGLRPVEQTPETTFVLAAALHAYPGAFAVHLIRDGRDVVCSLLERGWLSANRSGTDDAEQPFGTYARFWVEEERRDEFTRASDATRCGWAWRRYTTAARAVGERVCELRYEELVADPGAAAERLAAFLDLDPEALTQSLTRAHASSVGRWRRDLTPAQLADVEHEAGLLLAELGYAE
jgi:Sulfotransferase family